MKHEMRLREAPFHAIAEGRKTVEMRLYDEKRQKIRVGDEILFLHAERAGERVLCRVTALWRFASFAELYATLPLTACGYTAEEAKTASPEDMAQSYSCEEQARYGVRAIGVTRIG